MPREVIIKPGRYSGISQVSFSYNSKLAAYLKSVPGPLWDTSNWQVPNEFIEPFCIAARTAGFKAGYVLPAYHGEMREELHDYQREGISRIVTRKTQLLHWDTGLGKTLAALEAMRIVKPRRALIITLASVRNHWVSEIERWVKRGIKHHVVTRGSDDIPKDARIVIISYELLPKVQDEVFDFIVSDEVHFLKNSRSARSQAATLLVENNPQSYRLGLSATPITNHPMDMWAELNWLRPKSFGSWYRFAKHYFDTSEGAWNNLEIGAIKANKEGELRGRLKWIAHSQDKGSVSHLFKGITPKAHWYPNNTPSVAYGSHVDDRGIAIHLERTATRKVALVHEHMVATCQGVDRGCVLTYLRQTAKSAAKALSQDFKVHHVDGAMPVKKRSTAIQAAIEEGGILVATMHSVGTGIDLTPFARRVILAELYWTPAVVTQVIGRFNRLSNRFGANLDLIAIRGTLDEVMAMALQGKIEEMERASSSGTDLVALNSTLSQADVVADINRQLEVAEVDEYGVLL